MESHQISHYRNAQSGRNMGNTESIKSMRSGKSKYYLGPNNGEFCHLSKKILLYLSDTRGLVIVHTSYKMIPH